MSKVLLFISNSAFSMVNFRAEICKMFVEKGYRVVVACPPDRFSDTFSKMGVEFIEFEINPRSTNVFKEIFLIYRLHNLIRDVSPDLTFTYTIKPVVYGSFICRLQKKLSISVVTGLGFAFSNRGVVSWVARALYWVTLRLPEEVWFLNADDLNQVKSNGLLSHSRVRVLPSEGVDLARFYRRSEPGPTGKELCHDVTTFLLHGRLLRDKGVREFVEAARRVGVSHPGVQFQLLGPTDCAAPGAISGAEVAAWEAEGVIEYLGATTDVVPFLHEANCVVLPSYYMEGIPRALLEASACELPIITTDNVGCRDVVVNGRTGLVCEPRNAEDLADKMGEFMKLDNSERRMMGQRGREHVTRYYDLRNVIKIYQDVTKSLLAGS